MAEGASYVVNLGYGSDHDLLVTEAGGCLDGADPGRVSDRAITRGYDQCGTLGSGNHFLEVQVVDRVLDQASADVMGLREGQLTVLIHSGSRGLGYQVCDDYLGDVQKRTQALWLRAARLAARLCAGAKPGGTSLPRCACGPRPITPGATASSWRIRPREVFAKIFGKSWEQLGMEMVYDVAHNIAKFEDHDVGEGRSKQVCVHRKGATRAFPPGHPDIPSVYRGIGQPVIIPGSMGTASWVLAGQAGSMEHSFGTSCHGAGRMMSRTAAVKLAAGRRIDQELDKIGIIARARGHKGLAEEQPAAYKDVDHVVDVVDKVGISKKVARLRPIGVIKG